MPKHFDEAPDENGNGKSRNLPQRRVIVGFSGGVTSAWAACWALRNFPKEEVVWLLINGGKRTVREEGDVLVAEPCP